MFRNKENLDVALKYIQVILFGGLLLHLGSAVFIPMLFGLLVAVVMYPFCRWLETKGWSRALAVTASLAPVFILFLLLIWVLIIQVNMFRNDLPLLEERIDIAQLQFQDWIERRFSLDANVQLKWREDLWKNLLGNIGEWIKLSINAILNGLFMLFIIPVFAALFLYNRNQFMKFLDKLVGHHFEQSLHIIVREVIHTYSGFIKGMVLVYLIVGILNTVGLLALGIDHALLFGMLCAIMTIIPYAGIIISAMLPISLAWISTGNIWLPLGVVLVFAFIQYLEANVIFPKVVGDQINVNTWATLVAIIAGGIIWGMSGMILFIPFVAILKIVSDNVPGMEEISILLGRDRKVLPTANKSATK
jgi:predicted PurR-regulated permease PerM